MVDISGKVVAVTGGRRGLGAALVDEVLARGARKVYSAARSSYADDRVEVITYPLDIRSAESVAAFAESVGDVEILFNNAGIYAPAPLLTGSFDDITDTLDVNTLGPLRVTRALAPILAANGGGAVVNVHSVLSWLGGAGAYGASKAALWSLTNSLRIELRPQGTHVVGVHVGFIDTDMAADVSADKLSPQQVAKIIADGLERDAAEILVDDVSVHVKAALSGPVEGLAVALG
ncbi:SDR family oxidoreductase [Mycobacterium paraterrae]|uniref:SDR family oxidoreductase n=1 Tax=Mycobacterium paraterrae TaxID=577492 RepID=A0ABY3VF40_9MYCO|nr:SDR family oxidoreductase [Mycobacterium paraterrae]UMB67888.1 SDR family oxidoreductase [Mycobacterium paraterrae]